MTFSAPVSAPSRTRAARQAAVRLAGARDWRPALIGAGYLVAALLLTWRLWAHPNTAIVAGNSVDASQFTWFLRDEATAVLHGRLPSLITTAMNAPQGISMMWNTTVLLPGVLLTPVTALAGPQVSLTLLLTAGFAGSAASLCYVLRRYGASRPAAILGGAIYGFSPALTHAAMGHFQLQFAVLPPLIIDAGLRLCLGTGRPLRTGAWLGLLIGAQIFIGEELLFETALAAALLVAVLAFSRPRHILAAARPAAAGLATAAGVTLLMAGWALYSQFFGRLAQHGSAFAADYYKNDLMAFVTPSAFQLLHTSGTVAAAARYRGGGPEYVPYLGWPLIGLLVIIAIAYWRHLAVRATLVTAAVLSLLSLGVHPVVNGIVHHDVSLPWGWLARLPLLEAGLPLRLSIIADGAVAAALAFAVDLALARLRHAGLSPGRAAAIVAAVTAVAVAPLVPLPLPATPVVSLPAGWSATLGALRLPAGATVLVVPVPTAKLTDALRWQADTGAPISLVGGYFEGPGQNGRAYIDGAIQPPPLTRYLNDLWTGDVDAPRPQLAEVRASLSLWDPAAVVVYAPARPVLRAYLEHLFGPPAVSYGGMLGWRPV